MLNTILLAMCFFALSLATEHSAILATHGPYVTIAAKVKGGRVDIHVDDTLNEMSWRAVNEGVNKQSNAAYHSAPIKILKAQSQVVASINYHLDVLVGESDCPKNTVTHEEFSSTRCSLKENSDVPKQLCKFSVWQKLWENFEQVTNHGCTNYVEGSTQMEQK